MTRGNVIGGLAPLAFLVAACVSSTPSRVPETLRGCWIERRGGETLTLRWFPTQGASWRGDRLSYRAGEEPDHQAFLIDATAGEKERFGWAVCPQDDGLPHGAPCKALYFGHAPKIAGDSESMEIRATKERLRFDLINGGARTTLFDGVRDGCDWRGYFTFRSFSISSITRFIRAMSAS